MKKNIKKSITKNSNGVESYNEYDENNNCIHAKYSNGDETWYEYDENGNEIHYKDSNGFEVWREYDKNNNLIHYKNSYGFEEWKEYDEYGNEIHYKNSDGDEEWREFDKNGNKIHYKSSNGFEEWKEYDKNNNLIHSKDSDGYEEWKEYEYYEDYLTIEELGKKIIDSIEVEEIRLNQDYNKNELLHYLCKAKYNGVTFEGEYYKMYDDKLDNYHMFLELVFNYAYIPSNETGLVFSELFTEEEMDAIYAYYRSTEEFQQMEDSYHIRNEEEEN